MNTTPGTASTTDARKRNAENRRVREREALASLLRQAVYHVTGRTMTTPEAYVVARFLLAAGWTHPDTEGREQVTMSYATEAAIKRAARAARLDPCEGWPTLPLRRTEAGWPSCATCDGGGCPDCTDPA